MKGQTYKCPCGHTGCKAQINGAREVLDKLEHILVFSGLGGTAAKLISGVEARRASHHAVIDKIERGTRPTDDELNFFVPDLALIVNFMNCKAFVLNDLTQIAYAHLEAVPNPARNAGVNAAKVPVQYERTLQQVQDALVLVNEVSHIVQALRYHRALDLSFSLTGVGLGLGGLDQFSVSGFEPGASRRPQNAHSNGRERTREHART